MTPRTGPTAALALLLALLVAVPAAAQEEPETNRRSDNVTFVAHDQYPQGTDLFFQRRDGEHVVDGETVEGPRDYLFAGADASSAGGGLAEDAFLGVRVYDVTDPTTPQLVTTIPCGGYHADVAVYEDLLIQTVDSAGTNTGCPESLDPDGKDQAGVAGLRIYDVSDPARPVVAGFVTAEDMGGSSAHNVTVLPWAGVAYVAGSSFTDPSSVRLPIVDLTDPAFPVTNVPMRDISPTAVAECHDIGLDPENELAFCAAVEQTFIWDVSDPVAPTEVSAIRNLETIHHAARLAPDGTTLVLNDELGGAAAATGCAPTTQDPVGALWFYDISDPAAPSLLGTFSTSEASPENPCTSHFYNFVPGTSLLAVGWYKSGMIVVDYSALPETSEFAVYEPVGGDFWTAYYWNGYFFGSSFGGDGTPDYGGDVEAGGLWVIDVADVPTVAPSVYDQGTSWSPWTGPTGAPVEAPAEDVAAGDTAGDDAGGSSLPATGGGLGLAALGLGMVGLAGAVRRRRG